ncbi:MAG: substrate-binding domain-containing protein [Anaerolineales bacterium]|nr:substrate-binding domain-containing protein [Anaerolineales bacterium]
MKHKAQVVLGILLIMALLLPACTTADAPVADVPEEDVVAEEPAAAEDAGDVELTVWEQMRADVMAQLEGFRAPEDTDMRIGVLMITMANPFWVTFADGAQAMGEELGITVDIHSAPTEGDVSSQLSTCETMVASGYDAIVIYPITANNLNPCILAATEAGIPVIEPDTRIDAAAVAEDGGVYTPVFTLDFVDQGAVGAQYIVDQLGEEGGEVAIIEGLSAAPQSQRRRDGAMEVFENAENITFLTSQAGDWDRTVALNVATNIIQAHPEIRGIYCANDVMALAAAEAAIAAGLGDQIVIVGTDFIEDAKQGIRDGVLAGSVAFSPFVWGEISVMMGVMAVDETPIPDSVVLLSMVVNADNVDLVDDWK